MAVAGRWETVYSFSNHLADPRYVTPLTTWLAGRELIPTFATQEGSTALFHDITKTSGFNDDTVTLNFSNDSREIERLINYHNAGAQVEIWDFYPEVDGGSAYCRFIGTLQTPTSHGDITQGFVRLTAVSGLASSDILIPHLAHSQNCRGSLPSGPGAAMSIDQRKSHPCTYNRDLDGDLTKQLWAARKACSMRAATPSRLARTPKPGVFSDLAMTMYLWALFR